MLSHKEASTDRDVRAAASFVRPPSLSDGAAMWRVARESGSLDLNSSYAYLLFARDFARTCRVAVVDGEVVGFVLGYLRPDDPACLFVWQIAVDAAQRGRGLSTRLLDSLLVGLRADGTEVVRMETTITDDNAASQGLFRSFAARWGAEVEMVPLFEASHFPDAHSAEPLYRISPLAASERAAGAQD